MKTLLVVIKDPAASTWEIEYAIGLSRDLHLDIHLLYIENTSKQMLTGPDMSGTAMEQFQRTLEEKASNARDTLTTKVNQILDETKGQVVLEVSSLIGNEVALISQMIDDGKAQMVLMAREGLGTTGFKTSFINEVTRKVNCPVWIIPENTRYRSVDSIIYATDYQEEDIPTLKKVIDLTHFVSPEITALHITDAPDFEVRIKNAGFQKLVQNKTGYDDLTVKALVEKNEAGIPEMIGAFASREKSNLIVVLKENKPFFDRIFSSSTSNEIAHDTGYPVLVYHSPES